MTDDRHHMTYIVQSSVEMFWWCCLEKGMIWKKLLAVLLAVRDIDNTSSYHKI